MLFDDEDPGVDGCLQAAHADLHHPPARPDRLDRGRRRRPEPGEVDDDVQPDAGEVPDVLGDLPDADVPAQRPDLLPKLGGVHLGPADHRHPGADLAQTAQTDDADLVPGLDPPGDHDRVIGGHAGVGAGGRLLEVHALGDPDDVLLPGGRLVGIAAVAMVAGKRRGARADADPAPDPEVRYSLADLGDDAGDLMAEGDRDELDDLHPARVLERADVRVAQPGRLDVNDHLPRCRRRLGDLASDQRLSGAGHPPSSHD
jgi:hypothetical protein